MWTRRVDLNICEPLGNGFRYAEGLQIFESRMITIPEAADGLKRIAQAKLTWLDEQMSDGRAFIAGANLSHGGYFALLHDGLFRRRRPTAEPRKYQRTGLVRSNGRPPKRPSLTQPQF